MDRISDMILEHKKTILISFIILTAICAVLMQMVNINFNLSDYLPENAPSAKALEEAGSSFSDGIPNISVYIKDVTIPEALQYKDKLSCVHGVDTVLWLDDVIDIYEPLEIQDSGTVEAWYKDGGALFLLSADSGRSVAVADELREITGLKGVISGEAVNLATIQQTTMNEIFMIMLYVVPLVLLILLISTGSWCEPVLFLAAIGTAILINEGTNIFIGEISYVTRATSAILQLAVSIDYAVFLLHSFAAYRNGGFDVGESMRRAIVKSSSAIAASAATTVFGFLALMLMKFRIGPDMGFVLAKGVLTSYISVMVLLPVLTIYTTKILDKTHHRPLLPSFRGFGKFAVRICIPMAVLVFIAVVPSFLAQRNNTFLYGSSGMHSEDSKVKRDADIISGVFGESQQMMLLIPEGDIAAESALSAELAGIPHINSVISYADTVGSQIPPEFLGKDQLSQFRSNGYSRIILNAQTSDEGEEAFAVTEAVRGAAQKHYSSSYHLIGQNVINYDLRETITGDNLPVLLASVIAIGLVLIVAFRSASLPLILLLTIESAVWINLGLPYFMGDSLNYIGYQIISSVQLGATIDYGILFAQRYLECRRSMDKREAARLAVSGTAASIITPAAILTIAGFVLGFVSSNGIISQLGTILGRGAAISAGMVLLFLPALLIMFDSLIQKTTMRKVLQNKGDDIYDGN